MILGVDIGGTKTLIATYTDDGKLKDEFRFDTSGDYEKFIEDFAKNVKQIDLTSYQICCVGVPGFLNREVGIVWRLGNLPWEDRPIAHDISECLDGMQVLIENDSRLGALAEARSLNNKYQRIFYLTISTGIGGGLVIDGSLSEDMLDMEIGKSPLLHEGKLVHWENFASGHAFVERFGKPAKDVDDPKIWQEYAKDIGLGLGVICSIFQVDAIILGGGLGQYLDKFYKFLEPYVTTNLHAMIKKPQSLSAAKHGEKAVIYGCYEYAKDYLAGH